MRKILDFISVISFLLTITMTGAIAYSYIYIKNPENQEKTKKFVKKEIQKMLPSLMPKLPTGTGSPIPTKPFSLGK